MLLEVLDVLDAAGREVVEDADLVAALQIGVGQMRADEPAPPVIKSRKRKPPRGRGPAKRSRPIWRISVNSSVRSAPWQPRGTRQFLCPFLQVLARSYFSKVEYNRRNYIC